MKAKSLYLAITIFITVSLQAQISVDATAGTTTGSYTTLKEAFDAVNAGTHQGAVTINVLESTIETNTAVLNGSTGTSSYTSVLIKPATGVNASITGSLSTAIIKLNGADNVTIDGSNDGSSSRNLTVSNSFVATTGTINVVIWVASLAVPAVDGAENVTLKNINVAGSTPEGTVAGMFVSGSTLSAPETPNNNLSIINNTFIRSQNGIFAVGHATNTDSGWIIKNNIIGSKNAADKMLFRGIAVQNAKNFEISGNTITGVEIAATATAQGILIGSAVTNGTIFNNKISDIKNTNTAGRGAVGLNLNSTSITANMLVYNNTISGVSGYGNAAGGGLGDNGNGIFISAGAGYKIYNNTVVMDVNQTVAGRPSAINVASGITTTGAVNLRNNIFVNTQSQAGEKYAIYSGAANTVFANIDFNDYYTTGANLGYIGSTRPALADIQTGFGGNQNSINVLPVFLSVTDFHLLTSVNTGLDNKATPLAEVTTDADGVARNATTPDVGSYEFITNLGTEKFSKNRVTYNNPVFDYLKIKHDNQIQNIEIFTLTGQSMKSIHSSAANEPVDMRNLSAGIYIVKINLVKETEIIKIIKS